MRVSWEIETGVGRLAGEDLWAGSHLGISISHLMFFILTFERSVREGGFLENRIQVDRFSILEGKSNFYEFLT